MSHEATEFTRAASAKATDDLHRKKLLKVISNYDRQVALMKGSQFVNWEEARMLASKIKDQTLKNLPDLLENFELQLTKRGAKILWAASIAEAQEFVSQIIKKHSVNRVVKSKSMLCEEIGLNEFLESQGVSVLETDLGELIVQLAGEKPYHIVTPAMHKSKIEVAELFHRTLGIPYTEDVQELTMAARAYLREAYCKADLGVSGANFLIAKEGAVVLTENEGNARLCMACPPVHVVIAGIEKVLPQISDLALFLPLLATSGTGQRVTAYNSIIFGPKRTEEADGPGEMYVILLDNGRTKLYADSNLQVALRCIRCGACLNACPVYKTIGGHAYDTTYKGPIGAVIAPALNSTGEWHHLSYASTLCGACSTVCPVDIPIAHLLHANRRQAVNQNKEKAVWHLAFKIWAWLNGSRWRLNLIRPVLRLSIFAYNCYGKVFGKLPLPPLAGQSFAKSWRIENEEQS